MSDHCGELADIVLHTIAPEALPGQISTISDREIEECIEVSAIALCWHLAAMADPTRRDQFMQKLPNETLGLAVCVEAAGIAVQKGITWDKALREIHDSIGPSAGHRWALQHRCDKARLSAAAQVIRSGVALASLANASAVQTHLPLA